MPPAGFALVPDGQAGLPRFAPSGVPDVAPEVDRHQPRGRTPAASGGRVPAERPITRPLFGDGIALLTAYFVGSGERWIRVGFFGSQWEGDRMAANNGVARAVRVHGVLILLVTAVVAAGAYAVSRFAPDTYRSSAVVLVQAGAGTASAMGTEKELARSAVVVRLAAGRIGADPDTLARSLRVSVAPSSDVLTISCEAADPDVARSRAQALADAYVEYRNQGNTANTLVAAATVTPLDAADVPDQPSTLPLWLVLAIGAFVGLIGGLCAAIVRERLSDRIRSRAEVERLTGLTVLATVPRTPRPRGPGAVLPVLLRAPRTPAAESYRYLRSRLQSLLFGSIPRDGAVSVLVAGAAEGEGRTTTAANLAVAFAQAGRSVVLVDADLRRPRLHTMFGILVPDAPAADQPAQGGLTGALNGSTPLAEALRETPVPRLRLLPAGPRTVETADLLDGPALAALMRSLRRECDVLVIDSAALLSVSDAIGLAALADRVLLVGDYRRGTRTALVRALAELGEVADGNVSGVLVNLPASAGGLIPRPRTIADDRNKPSVDRFASLNGPADGAVPTPKAATNSTVYISKAAVPGS
jgi:succinoglycan biosynthesis transport protein ExoP